MQKATDWRWWVVGVCVVGGFAGVLAAGFFLGQWSARDSVAQANAERQGLTARIPVIRKEEYAAGVASSNAKIDSLQKQLDAANARLGDFGDIKKLVEDSHDVNTYTLRFLGDRAKVADRNAAAQLKETKVAAAAAVDAKQRTEQVGAKVEVAVAKADEAASAVKQVDKKLETAVHPTAVVPPTPWIGNRR
ncbi:hypothetical protein [Caballeronia sp. DA-9]|uniref:hypothetical protein n=1 Tax=Caballeronia sp. DA-9 TaxID=3436237 RepID=UPI003F6647B8